jgi:hypothetical protein
MNEKDKVFRLFRYFRIFRNPLLTLLQQVLVKRHDPNYDNQL